ncbi:MAG: HEPN domain-containing protein [Bacteroidia bacterium]|nr:HEPN domain-containing protein [Bacteroidia bacterium]
MNSGKNYIEYRLARSAEVFQDAKLLAENKRWRSCVNRLYYSCFHSVNALLYLDGLNPKSHNGQKTKFLQLYIKTHRIDINFGQLYSRLIDWRQESDYVVYADFTETDVVPLIEKVELFNLEVAKIINLKL